MINIIQARFLVIFAFCFLVNSLLISQEPIVISNDAGHAWITSGPDGNLHIIYYSSAKTKGVYRYGKSFDKLCDEIEIPGTERFHNPKIDIAENGTAHIAFQKGVYGNATSSWYTNYEDESFITPERFADTSEIEGASRAYLPDVAADANGNVLVSFWSGEDGKDRGFYRWRDKDGDWGEIMSGLSTFHAAAPKVEEHEGGFYLFYGESDFVKNLLGPVDFGMEFGIGVSVNTKDLGLSIQNEGQNFTISSKGEIAATGNIRYTFEQGVGIWVSTQKDNEFVPEYLGTFENTVRGDESGFHPDLVFDEDDNSIYVSVVNSVDKIAYYAYYKDGEWSDYLRLRPEADDQQGDTRTGASLADVPGKGVVALYKGDSKLYARYLYLDSLDVKPDVSAKIIDLGSKNEISIFPNPLINGDLNVDTYSTKMKSIKITDITGNLIWEKLTRDSSIEVHNSIFPGGGNYLISVNIDGEITTSKIFVQVH